MDGDKDRDNPENRDPVYQDINKEIADAKSEAENEYRNTYTRDMTGIERANWGGPLLDKMDRIVNKYKGLHAQNDPKSIAMVDLWNELVLEDRDARIIKDFISSQEEQR